MGRQAILTEVTSNYKLYLMAPNYTPPVKRDEADSFWSRISKENWDNFLADLVDVGLITNEERGLTNGSLLTLDETALKHMSFSEFNQMQDVWTGNPLDWLEQMSFYCSKGIRFSQLDNVPASRILSHKAACDKVLQLTQEIWHG